MFEGLFSGRAKPQADGGDAFDLVTKSMARVRGLDLFGPFARSPNGRFALVWSDAGPGGGRGGFRHSGEGRYALLHDGRVVTEGRMERPNHGRVADNGVFLLNDWMFGEGLGGRVCAFASDGRALLAHQVEANLYNNGLSPDGDLACAQTANAPNDDSNRLLIFDIRKGELIGKFTSEIGWSDRYSFDAETRTVLLRQRGGGEYRFGFDGVFVDRETWLADGLVTGERMVLEALLRDAGGKVDATLARRWAEGLQRALGDKDMHPLDRARLLHLLAESHAELGDERAALAAYEAALRANPKLGVKRRIAQLQQQLASGSA